MDTKLLSGREGFSYSFSAPPSNTICDFWSWNSSDLISNTTRGAFAEYIVALACGIRLSCARKDWTEYDLLTNDGIRIEVKCSGYIQSWDQHKLSKIRFGCNPAQAFANQRFDGKPCHHSDVYVFCLHNCMDRETANAMNLDQWEFYILPTTTIDGLGNQRTISLGSLKALGPVCARYHEINQAIHAALNRR